MRSPIDFFLRSILHICAMSAATPMLPNSIDLFNYSEGSTDYLSASRKVGVGGALVLSINDRDALL